MGERTKFDQLADSIEMLTNHIITKKECFKQIAELFCDVNSESNDKCFEDLNKWQKYIANIPVITEEDAKDDLLLADSMETNSFRVNFTRLS